ncbi:hypothetical protein KEM60_02228 [Austwickia sp. TVS 96-490-7B]|uniref:trypsin-like serine peptidase n=1 Tax=Austwickia sp. TVS 96-490-7B TaxID=2830843 RepID=UPI001C597719|nr:trypsin-like peptidase domain-containing protein [Austwickia sp. TVS 96-490-7B]MBW3086017.1 hypothetical protein [Austwickia sp. TVS 96-490-7B]
MNARNTGSSSRKAAEGEGKCPPPNAENVLFPPRLDVLALAEATGAGPAYATILESICGSTDDSQPVEQYDGTLGVSVDFVASHQRPVVQVQWNDDLGSRYTDPGDVAGVRWGSGTLIAPDVMLTCGHLFDQDPHGWRVPRQNGTTTAISPTEIASNMHINVDYQIDPTGNLRAEVRFPIIELVEYRLGGIDMAVCRLAGTPGVTYGVTRVATADAVVGDMLAIIGHPAGQPKRVEAGPAVAIGEGRISYSDIDTLGGNSGSGILQATTGRLVGVHTNGGCAAQGGANSGVTIGAVLAVSPTVTKLSQRTVLAQDVNGTLLQRDTIRAWDSHLAQDTLLAQDTGLGKDSQLAQDTLLSKDTHLVADTPLARDTHLSYDLNTGWRDVAHAAAPREGVYTVLQEEGTNVDDVLHRTYTSRGKDILQHGHTSRAGDTTNTFYSDDDPHTWNENANTFCEGAWNPGAVLHDPIVNPVSRTTRLRPFVQAGAFRVLSPVQQYGDMSEVPIDSQDDSVVVVDREELLGLLSQAAQALDAAMEELMRS